MAVETVDFEVELFEIFNSQEGEFPKVGVYSTFVRFPKCNISCPFCFGIASDHIPTLLLQDNKPIKLNDVKVGDVLLTFDGNQNIVKTNVYNVIKRTVTEYYRININNVDYFVTPEHPFFTTNGLKRADELKLMDEIVSNSKKATVIAIELIHNELEVHNISCKPYNTYLIDNMWVHNCDTMENPANKVRTFKYSEIKALVQETNALTFTGGEPSLFIHDIIKILNQLLEDQVYLDYVKIETNGVELNKLVNMIDVHYPQLKNRFIISWSPKIYNKSLFETMLNHLYETDLTNVFIKIVGVPQDEFKIKKFLELAKEQHGTKLMKRIALMPLSIVEKGVSLKKSDEKSLNMIFDLVRDYKVNITPRLHEILDVR